MVRGPTTWDFSQLPAGAPGGEPTSGRRASRGPSTAITGTHEITVPFEGLKPEQLRHGWHEGFSPYRNLADNDDVRMRAFNFARQTILNHNDKTTVLRYKWADINYVLDGMSLYDWDNPEQVHSPKLYEMKETLKARIVSAVLDEATGRGGWFRTKGRTRMNRRQEEVLTAWHDYLNDSNNLESRLEELVDTMLVYGFYMGKTRWADETQWQVLKTRDKKVTKSGVKWTTQRRQEEVITYSGTRWDLIDPFWGIVDVDQTECDKMIVCGDRSLMLDTTIYELGRQQIFMNTEELEGQEPINWLDTYGDWNRESRSDTLRYEYMDINRRPQGAPKEFLVDELWGLFDPYGHGEAREMVVTIANGRTVLRVQENPYDDKHRPYFIGRATKKAFTFYGSSGMDQNLPLQIELDTLRSLAKVGTHLSVSPYVFVDDKEGLPETIWQAPPGKVFEVPRGSVQFTEINTPIDKMIRAQAVIERDMEGAFGAPRLLSGSEGSSDTATQYQGRRQEANERIRAYIRNVTDGLQQLLKQSHSLCSQYLTNAREFRVLGSRAKTLRAYEEVNPEMFDTEVDFEFEVVSKLHVVGLEVTNMQLFMNSVLPIWDKIPPGKVSPEALVDNWGKLLGITSIPGQEIVQVPTDPRDLMSQQEELILMLEGEYVPVSREDDHDEHGEFLDAVMSHPDFFDKPEHIRNLIIEHRFAHQSMGESEARTRRINENRAQQTQQAGYAGQGSTTNLERQTDRNSPLGGQNSPAEIPRGETPGPLNGQQVATPGRAQGFFQTQNEGGV